MQVNVGDADGQPPFKRRLLSAVVKVPVGDVFLEVFVKNVTSINL